MPLTTTVGNMQSLLAVPLLREDEVVGVMTLGRQQVEPFTDARSRWSRPSPTRP